MVLLLACVNSGKKLETIPTSATIIPTSPYLFQTTTRAVISTGTSTISPSPTSVPPTVILSDYPFAINAIWKYSAEISYQNPTDSEKMVTWTGYVIDKVVTQRTAPDGGIVFRVQEDLEPIPPREVWRTASTKEYSILEDGILEEGKNISMASLG
jgi:hypothetical protein